MAPSPEQPGQAGAAVAGGGSSSRSAAAGGRLADMVEPEPSIAFGESFPPATLIKIGVLAALMLAAHAWQIRLLLRQWTDPDWMHGYVIPLFSLYLLFSRRHELLAAKRKTGATGHLGLAIVLLSLMAQPLCVYPVRNYWAMQMCMIAVLFGLVLYLGGTSVIRLTWLPILFLFFAMPLSPSLYRAISLPLQGVAAQGSAMVMRLVGVRIEAVASSLTLVSTSGASRTLTVAEACNGMRLLWAFLALGVAMAYLDDKPIAQRVVLVASAIPIAILCNIIRVTITCLMYYVDKEELGKDFMHYFTGVAMLVPAFLMLWLLAWIMRNMFVEVPEDEPPAVAEGAG